MLPSQASILIIKTVEAEVYVMSKWDSAQYLKFKSQRTQPAIDLAKRLTDKKHGSILDIGCGPGNSTAVLRQMFPDARILGIDSSENMINKAQSSYNDIDFALCDITADADKLNNYDIIFSNACLQWIPNHEEFIPRIFSKLTPGGTLAVQMPMNGSEALFKIMADVVSESKWNFCEMQAEPNKTLDTAEYYDILASLTNSFDIWESVYYHSMPSVEAMTEWIKGTRLRPYLNALSEEKADELQKEITEHAKCVYKPQKNGEIIFKFRRFFFTAKKT